MRILLESETKEENQKRQRTLTKWKYVFFMYYSLQFAINEFFEIEISHVNQNFLRDNKSLSVFYIFGRISKFSYDFILTIVFMIHVRYYTVKLRETRTNEGRKMSLKNKLSIFLAIFVCILHFSINDIRQAITMIINLQGTEGNFYSRETIQIFEFILRFIASPIKDLIECLCMIYLYYHLSGIQGQNKERNAEERLREDDSMSTQQLKEVLQQEKNVNYFTANRTNTLNSDGDRRA